MSSITSTWTVTAFPPKKNLVPRFGRKTLKGREVNHPSKVARKHSDWRRLLLMVKAIGVCRNEYSESMDRLYMDEYDKTRERKVIKFS
jgi:hypothetical protein